MTRYRIYPAYTPDRAYDTLSMNTEAPVQPGWFVRLTYDAPREGTPSSVSVFMDKKTVDARVLQCIVDMDGEVILVVDDRT